MTIEYAIEYDQIFYPLNNPKALLYISFMFVEKT